MGYMLKHTEPPIKVSIIPRGESALGFLNQNHLKINYTQKKQYCLWYYVLLGGRCSEKLIYDNVSTGASDDIEKYPNI